MRLSTLHTPLAKGEELLIDYGEDYFVPEHFQRVKRHHLEDKVERQMEIIHNEKIQKAELEQRFQDQASELCEERNLRQCAEVEAREANKRAEAAVAEKDNLKARGGRRQMNAY